MSRAMTSGAFELVGHDFFTRLCETQRFEPLDGPAERHGSWEWAFRKSSSELDRFVVITFTSLPATVPESDSYTMEVWACAEKNKRYTRKPVAELHVSLGAPQQQSLRSALQTRILQAMTVAERFTTSDLDEAYVPPRSRQGEDPNRRSG